MKDLHRAERRVCDDTEKQSFQEKIIFLNILIPGKYMQFVIAKKINSTVFSVALDH